MLASSQSSDTSAVSQRQFPARGYPQQKRLRSLDPERWNRDKRGYYGERRFGPPRPWTDDEIREIHTSTVTDTELGRKLKRSVMAIQTRRSLTKDALGRIAEGEVGS